MQDLLRLWQGIISWLVHGGFHALLICEVFAVHLVVCFETVLIVYLVGKIDEFRENGDQNKKLPEI